VVVLQTNKRVESKGGRQEEDYYHYYHHHHHYPQECTPFPPPKDKLKKGRGGRDPLQMILNLNS